MPAPQGPDGRRSENEDSPRASPRMREPANGLVDARRQRLQQPAARNDLVLCRGCFDTYGLHLLIVKERRGRAAGQRAGKLAGSAVT